MTDTTLPTGVRERLAVYGARTLSDAELLTAVCGKGLPRGWPEVRDLAWCSFNDLTAQGYSPSMAERLAAAFELGRRGAWGAPKRGEVCREPSVVYELCRDLAAAPLEQFAVVLLDVRCRLVARHVIAVGSLTQCPVNPRDVLRPAIREGAHGVVFVHNHPSGDPSPSPEDADLTERLRMGCELTGIVARDHVVVASGGYFSFVEAGRWRR